MKQREYHQIGYSLCSFKKARNMNKTAFRQRVLVAVGIFLSIAWCGAEKAELKVPSVVIEVVGYGIPAAGKSVADLHREALEDALKNAVVQAQVQLDVQAHVEGMRLKQQQVYSRSTGFVETSRVLEAGYISKSVPSVYRVRMEVTVRASSEKIASQIIPPIALKINFAKDETTANRCEKVLSTTLKACGIRVVNLKDASPGHVLSITLVQLTDPKAGWELLWKMGTKENRVVGRQTISNAELSDFELKKLGIILAQNIVRLRGL
jgi:hypothetical protein